MQARTKPAVAVVRVRAARSFRTSAAPGRRAADGGLEVVCQHLRAAATDEQVKAVVLRVDSGGSYIASDAIRREVLRLRESGRPVVACMGDMAASGGYFVSMPTDRIHVAQPTTLTGSIGVFAGKFVTTEIKEKLGTVLSDVTAGAWASFMSANSGFGDEQWATLDRRLDAIYADFTGKAAADRGMALDVLEPLAHGRVWTGVDARQRGLVDHLGGMGAAIDQACALAGLRRDDVAVRAVSMLGFLKQFRPAESSESISGSLVTAPARFDLDSLVETAAARLGLTATGVLSVPFGIEVHAGLGR